MEVVDFSIKKVSKVSVLLIDKDGGVVDGFDVLIDGLAEAWDYFKGLKAKLQASVEDESSKD